MNPAMNDMQIAALAQRAAKILNLDCPPNYHCGGPVYAALAAFDTILQTMGIGIALLQRQGALDTTAYQKHIREHAVLGDGVLSGHVQHKSQILSSALLAVLCDLRQKELRESHEATEHALLATLQWYFEKTKTSKEDFWKKLNAWDHDELIQLEKAS